MNSEVRITKGFFRNRKVFFSLKVGRETGSPLKCFLRNYHASEEEITDFSIFPSGYRAYWKGVDEDLSACGMRNTKEEQNTKQE